MPSTHAEQLRAAHNSCSMESNAIFWPLFKHAHIHTYKIKLNIFLKADQVMLTEILWVCAHVNAFICECAHMLDCMAV